MSEYSIAFWNVENLFDVENSPRRTEKLQRTLKDELEGWTQAVLDQKVKQLCSIIRKMNGGAGPDLLGVCEVENEIVLKLLVKELKPLGRNYGFVHFDTKDERGIDVAFIYDKDKLTAGETFSHYIVKRSATRDLLQVNFKTKKGNYLIAVGNHWPSRTAGPYESEPFRLIAGETLAYFHERIREVHNNDIAVLAMGDFNDTPFCRSLLEHAQSEQSKTKISNARAAKFLNMMWPLLSKGEGSYYYDNNAFIFDQFLVSKGLVTGKSKLTAVEGSAEVFRAPEMTAPGEYRVPVRFGRPSSGFNQNGFSDHFPIVMKLKES